MRHPQRVEDPMLAEAIQSLAGNEFEGHSQEDEANVAINSFRSGISGQRSDQRSRQQFVPRAGSQKEFFISRQS